MSIVRNLLCIRCVVIGVILIASRLYAAFEFNGVGWNAASANIKVIGISNLGRELYNPALSVSSTEIVVLVEAYRPFIGLNLQTGALLAKSSIFGIPTVAGVSYFGDEVYSEISASVGSSWSPNPDLRIGLRLNYFQVGVVEVDTQQDVTTSFGLSVRLAEKIVLGSLLDHLLKFGELNIPQRFQIGLGYLGEPLNLLVAIEKEGALPLELCLGFETSFSKRWQLAAGYRDQSNMFSVGWRFIGERIVFHYTHLIHPTLPSSSGFGVEWHFN